MILLNKDGKSNIHTHTAYCDGKNSPDEMVEKAISLDFAALGFSGHEYSPNDEDFCMSKEDTERYRRDILELQARYKDRIEIYLGIERDYFGIIDSYDYDYVIGSLHYAPKGDVLISVDNTETIMAEGVEKYFGGDYRDYVESYYSTIADIVVRTRCDVVGHFDLVKKFNEGGKYFDENAQWYRKAAADAVRQVAEANPIFEINTGAMAKGYRTDPYPAGFIIEEIEKKGCSMIINSDCHDKEKLDFGFVQILGKLK